MTFKFLHLSLFLDTCLWNRSLSQCFKCPTSCWTFWTFWTLCPLGNSSKVQFLFSPARLYLHKGHWNLHRHPWLDSSPSSLSGSFLILYVSICSLYTHIPGHDFKCCKCKYIRFLSFPFHPRDLPFLFQDCHIHPRNSCSSFMSTPFRMSSWIVPGRVGLLYLYYDCCFMFYLFLFIPP